MLLKHYLLCSSEPKTIMSTVPDPKFPSFPGLIFGLSPTKHRRDPIKMLLARYNVKVRSNDKKEEYLEKLIDLEKSIGEREKEALLNWFAGENTCRSLAALLGDALKVSIASFKTPVRFDLVFSNNLKRLQDNDLLTLECSSHQLFQRI